MVDLWNANKLQTLKFSEEVAEQRDSLQLGRIQADI
jgi:hypothetical protein